MVGRSPMASRTVTVRSGAPGMRVSTAQYATPPGRLTVSCGLLQHDEHSSNEHAMQPYAGRRKWK
jgi:uncharacterized protein YodC (DUF2158 family)